MTAKQALRKWQKKLHLTNWDITVEVHTREEDEQMEKNDGYVQIRPLDYEASIFIRKGVIDEEEVVVHELWHIVVRDKFQTLVHLLPDEELDNLWDYCGESLVRLLTKVSMEERVIDVMPIIGFEEE